MLKKLIKQCLGENIEIHSSEFNKENASPALKEFIDENPAYLNKYSQFGKRRDEKEFYPAIKKIEKGFYLLNQDLDVYDEENFVPVQEIYTVRTGNPIDYKPFPMAKEYITRILFSKYLFRYPSIEGHVKARGHFVNYLIKEGFKETKEEGYDGIGIENVIFSCSTTHAFNMILDTILKDEDVVIMTGPNYGLFAVDPERMNGRVEVLPLREEDDFYVNPKLLSKKIDEVNDMLKKKWEGKLDYIPRVKAFLHMNPHNPLGKVVNHKNIDILKGIGDVCLEKGVFVIDDMIYRDLTFDLDDKAVPMASIPKYFNNTITLFGLSKSYGLAGIRAGAIVAPAPICKGVGEKIFATMDSLPVFQVQALAGAFNGTKRRYKQAKKYFKKLIDMYKYQLDFVVTLIEGIDKVENNKKRIIKDMKKHIKDEKLRGILLNGVPGLKVRKNTYPESGFFIVVDFTDLKNKSYDGDIIKNETDLVKYLYKKSKFKTIMGQNMSWPYEDEMIGRFNFAIAIPDLIDNFIQLQKSLNGEYVCIKDLEK